jgi:raffinose/stachyose/melibiose transport system permease protein
MAPSTRSRRRRLFHVEGLKPGYRWYTGYLYLLPGLLIYGLFVFLPILDTVRYSLFHWNGISPPTFLGLGNYAALLRDAGFLTALAHNAAFIFFYTVLPIVLALFLTALMTRRPLRGMAFFRAGLFVPQVMSMIVVGVAWRWILNPINGPLNQLLRAVGLGRWALPWLGDFTWALPAVGSIGTWVEYGFCMVLFIAGVQRIEPDLYDAARIDGANAYQEFRYVTLPGLRSEMTVAAISTLIAALRVFDLVFVTTRGGPGTSTRVVAYYIWSNAFVVNNVGYAAALAVVLTLIILAISVGVLGVQDRLGREE